MTFDRLKAIPWFSLFSSVATDAPAEIGMTRVDAPWFTLGRKALRAATATNE